MGGHPGPSGPAGPEEKGRDHDMETKGFISAGGRAATWPPVPAPGRTKSGQNPGGMDKREPSWSRSGRNPPGAAYGGAPRGPSPPAGWRILCPLLVHECSCLSIPRDSCTSCPPRRRDRRPGRGPATRKNPLNSNRLGYPAESPIEPERSMDHRVDLPWN